MPKIEIKGWESFKPVFESNGYTAIDEKKKLPIAEDQIKMTYLDFIEDGKSKKDAIESTAKRCKVEVSDVEELIKDINETEEVTEGLNTFGPFMFADDEDKDKLVGIYKDALDGYANWQKGFKYQKSDYKKAYTKAEQLLKKKFEFSNSDIRDLTENIDLNEGLVVIVHSDDKDETGKYLSSKGIKYSSKDDKKDVIFIIKDLGDLKPSDAKEEIETQLADKDVNAHVKSMSIKEGEEVNEDKTDTSKEALESWEQSLKDAKTDKDKEVAKAWIQHYKKLLNILKESEEIESLDEKSTLEKQIKEFYKALTSDGKSHADALAEISDELDIDKKELEKVIKEQEEIFMEYLQSELNKISEQKDLMVKELMEKKWFN